MRPGEPAAELVVDGDAAVVAAAPQRQDEWHAERRQPVGVRTVDVGVGDDQPVDPPPEHQLDASPLLLRVVVRDRDERLIAQLERGSLDRLVEMRLDDVGQMVDEHADRAGLARAQARSREIGPVSEVGGDSADHERRRVAVGGATQRA